ncbi:Hypothetical predicted protein [Podarcis lilfordi]|uniref:Uncharacterized protein n=1 Tax=Podarcis lilfordi TaxID=74358 RepID=A0AA35L1J5_9SAUR|nr:Hypothetical predicted protein [Podarcis lilfordi]
MTHVEDAQAEKHPPKNRALQLSVTGANHYGIKYHSPPLLFCVTHAVASEERGEWCCNMQINVMNQQRSGRRFSAKTINLMNGFIWPFGSSTFSHTAESMKEKNCKKTRTGERKGKKTIEATRSLHLEVSATGIVYKALSLPSSIYAHNGKWWTLYKAQPNAKPLK